MDHVFAEEEDHLKKVESRLEAIVRSFEARKVAYQEQLTGFVSYDNEDRDRRIELTRQMQAEERSAEEFRSYQASPYFGRMDLDIETDGSDDIDTKVFYIGYNGIHKDGEDLVFDWHSDIGNCYYMTMERSFRVKGTDYQLALRRALNIENGRLLSYTTAYDCADVTLEGEVVDPFLLTVLRDKRRHNRLTDIIRSIQANQNEIIRLPRQTSFVVQGCAGSGKTMILLHRLSVILFNNRSLPRSSFRIITPNTFFDAHINDLSHELGLDRIVRSTVEEFYVELIHRFSSRIEVEAAVSSEKDLSESLLRSIYSQEYADRLIQHYHDYWDETVQQLSQHGLPAIFERLQKKYPDVMLHQSVTYTELDRSIRELQRELDRSQGESKRINERLADVHRDLSTGLENGRQIYSRLKEERNRAVESLKQEQAAAEQLISKCLEENRILKRSKQEIMKQIEAQESERDTLAARLQHLSVNAAEYLNLDDVVLANDDISYQILALTTTIRLELEHARTALESTPFYSFSRRNQLRRQIETLENRFTEQARSSISDAARRSQAKLTRLEEELFTNRLRRTEIEEKENSLITEGREATIRKNATAAFLALFAEQTLPEAADLVATQGYSVVAPVIYPYLSMLTQYSESKNRVEKLRETEEFFEQESQRLALLPTTEEEATLEECASIVGQLRFSELSRNVLFKDLLSEYRSFQQPYRRDNFRHKLYLRLLLCSCYFSIGNNGENYVNIDEAQDISISEYRLLRRILGKECVFNLYGDVNQLVYSYKGIQDWDEIRDITNGNIYILNENYRNTIPITRYCNEQFHADVYPIGIPGEDVCEECLTLAVQDIIRVKIDHPESRVAILYRHGRKKIIQQLKEALSQEHVSWGSVDDHLISVISVEAAKGLEFDTVVVITDHMTENEKYIAYTRALDRLIVVPDIFPDEDIPSNLSDEVEEIE